MNKLLPIILLTCFLATDIELDNYRAALTAGKIDYEQYIELRDGRLLILNSNNKGK